MALIHSWLVGLRRWRRWIVLLAILLLIRVALPYVLRPLLASQASKTLRVEVKIGGVDLALYRCGIALQDVQIGSAGDQPLIAWKRLAVAVRWLPLFSRRVLLRELILEDPSVAVDREEDGDINLLALVPSSAPPAPGPTTPEAIPAGGSGWTFGADKLLLRNGNLRFRDFKAKGSPPLMLHLEGLQLTDIAVEPGIYRDPSQLQLTATTEGGSLSLRARVSRTAGGQALEADVEARNIPLHRVPYYVDAVGWRALDAHLDGQLSYRFDSQGQNAVRGSLGLHDIALRVPEVEEPALTCRRLSVHLDPLDLGARRVHVSAFEIEGASTFIAPPGGDRMPLLTAAAPRHPTPNSAAPPAPASPWHWSLGRMRVSDSHLRLLRSGAPLDVAVELTASDLADTAERPAPVHLVGTVGKGSLTVDGNLRLARLGFAGNVRAQALPLTEILAAAAIAPLHLFQAAEMESQLLVEAGMSATPPGSGELASGDVRVRGKVSLAAFAIANPGAADPLLRAKSVDLGIEELVVPALLAEAGAAEATRPLRVALGDLQITGLNAKVIRTPEGISLPVLPGAAVPAPAAASASGQENRSAGADAAPATARLPAQVSLETLRLRGANLALEDRTVKPVFDGTIAPLTIDARGIRWPELAVAQLRINGSTQRGKISVSGALAHNKGQFTVTTDDLALTPFNPYATTLAGYRIGKGKVSVTTTVTIAEGRYDARNALVLHDLDVHGAGGESGFQQAFGLPISMALALMRDPNGDIALDIPVQIDREGVRVGVWEVIRGAIKRAIMGALTAPLKLLGAVFGAGGKVEAVAPTSLFFHPGRDELTPEGVQQAEQFADLLSSRPALNATLSTAVSETDVRWLSEQALRAEWDKEGFFGKLKDLPQRSARNAVSRALEARAQDQEGKLDPEDAAALERWLNERPPPSEAQLERLSEARLARVEQLLRARGVESRRLTRGTIGDTPVPDSPAVSLELSPGA